MGSIRARYGLKARFDRLRERGMLTTAEMAATCGVATKTISQWRRKGQIPAHRFNDRNEFLYEHPGPNSPRSVKTSATAIKLGLGLGPDRWENQP